MPTAGRKVKAWGDSVTDQVTTEETTTSASYDNLGTVGPDVAVSLEAGQNCLIVLSCGLFIDTSPAGARARMSFAVSGAETIAASNNDSIFTSVPADYVPGEKTTLFTATAGGSYTFTAKYLQAGTVTATFANRRITAIPQPV